jgi:HNH endonuclease
MPECRVEVFTEPTDYDPIVIIGEIAHVAGAADTGPGAVPELGTAQRNDYENLILLCKNCHARIDGQTGFYRERPRSGREARTQASWALTGARSGEAGRLKWSDLDTRSRTIAVRHAKAGADIVIPLICAARGAICAARKGELTDS